MMSQTVNGIETQGKKTDFFKKIIFGIIGIIVIISVLWYWNASRYITTEDARISSENISIASKLSGKIKTINVKQGDLVKKDQVLLVLDNTDLEIALNQAKANYEMATLKQKQAQEALGLQLTNASSQIKQAYNNLEIAKANLQQATNGSRPEELKMAGEKLDQSKVLYDKAKDNLDRTSTLYQSGAVSEIQYKQAADDKAIAEQNYNQALESYNIAQKGARDEQVQILENQVSSAQEGLQIALASDKQSAIKVYDRDAANIQVAQAQYALDAATLNYNNSFIKSPCDGIVGLKSANEGEMATMGQSLFSIINPEKAWVSANIKETQVGKIKQGAKVKIYVDAEDGKKYEGEVYEIGTATNSTFSLLSSFNSQGSFTKVTQLIPIKVKFVSPSNSMKIGASVKIKVKT